MDEGPVGGDGAPENRPPNNALLTHVALATLGSMRQNASRYVVLRDGARVRLATTPSRSGVTSVFDRERNLQRCGQLCQFPFAE